MCKERKYLLLIFAMLIALQTLIFGQTPDPPKITSISIDPKFGAPGAVSIFWLPNTAPEVTGYILYREINDENHTGYIIITQDLLPTDFTYSDLEVDATKSSVNYKIASLPDGLPGKVHSTIFLHDIEFDSCKMTNTITWNNYGGWDGGAYYNIIDGTGAIIPGADGLSDTIFVHKVQANTNYNYTVRGIQNLNPSFKSSSNQVSNFTTALQQPNPNELFFSTIINYGDSVSFTVNIDNNADLLGHSLMVSDNENSGFSEVSFLEMDGSSTLEFGHIADNQPLFYKVNAIGICGDTVLSTQVVQPLVLKPDSDESQVTLNWNKSFTESTETYEMNVIVDGGTSTTLPNPTGLSETYLFDELGTETSEVYCFTLKATDINNNTSFSNEVCVSRVPKIDPPTAFSPNRDGLNDYFGPFWENNNENSYIKNAIVEEIKIKIYDKYGGVVFSTDKAYRRWDGAVKGRYVPEGGYIYYLWFKTAQGKSYEHSGTINVVYP